MQFELCLLVYQTAVNELYSVLDSIDAGFCQSNSNIYITLHGCYGSYVLMRVLVITCWNKI